MSALTAPDQQIRDEALETSRSFIVESSAGSGKTDLLIARYLALLSKVSHPRQILAVTYTRKAAVQMKNRVIQKLNQAKAKEAAPESPWEGFLLSLAGKAIKKHDSHPAILFNPESLQIGTFHSFCASLLRGWPIEAAIPPGLDLLDDIDQETLLQTTVDQYVESILSNGVSSEERNAYINRLAAVNNYPDALSKQIKGLLGRRDRLKDFPLLSEKRPGESLGLKLQRRLENYVAYFLSELQAYFLQNDASWVSLKRTLTTQKAPNRDKLPDVVPGTSLKDVARWKGVAEVFITGGGTPRKQFGPKQGFPNGFVKDPSAAFIRNLPLAQASLLAFVAYWPDPEEDNVGISELIDILILASGASAKLQELIRNQGMDYLELEMGALRALSQAVQGGRPSESLIFHQEHLRHILVDEAQDMNDIQLEILGRLAEGWEPGDGRTVFFVGDPKQSIYRFRRAEVELFHELEKNGLPRNSEGPLPLKRLLLIANFRSRPHLISFANRVFEQVMSSPRKEYDEVQFSHSEPARGKADLPIPTKAAVFTKEYSGGKGPSLREREARWVASEVATLHRERPGETIAILIPARTNLASFVKALRECGVPVRLLEGEPMKQKPEVHHLLNLFTAMIRPYDDVAWAGAVRAPWFRVSNQILFDLKEANGFWSERILSRKDTSPELAKFCESIVEARKMFGRELYSSTLSRLWEDLDGPRHASVLYGAAGVSNARAFFDLLNLCSRMPGEEALLQLHRLLEDAYTPPDPKGAFSNVYMMTIHKAKGLEFDHVFAVNLDYNALAGGRWEQPVYRMERLPGEERRVLAAAAADRRTGQQNLGSYLLKDLSEKRTLAETRRLFYVAATRAKESLTLSGVGSLPKDDKEDDFTTPLSSLLKMMKPDEENFVWLVDPLPSPSVGIEEKAVPPYQIPPPFDAEPLPYQVRSPSRIEDETSQASPLGAEEEEGYARARGVVIHQILETLARKQSCPEGRAIAVALEREGIPFKEAGEMAPQVLEEALQAWEKPDLLSLRKSAKEVHVEWAVEDYDGRRTVRVGRFDMLLKMEDKWLLLDYKTGRPEKDLSAWLHSQKEHYRPQLDAYAEMVARGLNVPKEKIEWAILFTALPRLVWQEEKIP